MEWALTRRGLLTLAGAAAGLKMLPAWTAELKGIASQPYFAAVNRALEALVKLGAPVASSDAQQITNLARQNDSAAVALAEKILDRYTLAQLSIDADGTLHVGVGGAPRTLVEQGWRMFLVRLANPSARTGNIALYAGQGAPGEMMPGFSLAQRPFLMDTLNKAPLIEKMWLLSELYEATPSAAYGTEIPTIRLSEYPIEYRVVQLFSRDSGRRSSNVTLYSLPGSNSSDQHTFDFECLPSRNVTLGVLDTDGRACVASLTIKDKSDHIYPPQAMRLAPDMAFQPHIYRADGENVRLPDGEYIVKSKRGPEYVRGIQTITIDGQNTRVDVKLKRWIDPAKWGWYSGDTHIHAAGCAHYQIPTEGVEPETMIRHVRGEGLSIGDVLTWGPSWYYQKQFFSGKAESPEAKMEHPDLQTANNATLKPRATPKDSESLLRYDIEVSGFPSSLCGHLILLQMKEQDYPGTKLIEDWPSWNLPILKWARSQGCVTGYAHCSAGMMTDSKELPNYEIPPFDSIGANEAIIDVTHDLVDFLSGCNGLPVAELNAWYHLLNCGFKLVMVGETDYPCFSPPTDSRPGMGRSYVQLEHRPTDDGGYDAWVRSLQKGRLYHGDGRTHFLEFKINGRGSGDELALRRAGRVSVQATVAAWLEPEPTPDSMIETNEAPWHIEHARLGKSREVPLELIVNGMAVERVNFIADGKPRPVSFKTNVARSSWIALRILPSGHTHPVYIKIADKPIRASKRSAEWCRQSVDKLWEVKSPHIRESESSAAAAAYEHARQIYDQIANEAEVA
jgi:hypothetical protein